jgi:hypothetical protein
MSVFNLKTSLKLYIYLHNLITNNEFDPGDEMKLKLKSTINKKLTRLAHHYNMVMQRKRSVILFSVATMHSHLPTHLVSISTTKYNCVS